MPQCPIGTRVVAVRNATADTVYLFGRGLYAGLQPVPYWNPDARMPGGLTWRQHVESDIRHQMSRPQVEWFRDGQPTGIDQYGAPIGDARTFDERVEAALTTIAGNPCIDLDDGGRVWGYFCWWSPETQFDQWCADREQVVVPVPDPLPHSLRTIGA